MLLERKSPSVAPTTIHALMISTCHLFAYASLFSLKVHKKQRNVHDSSVPSFGTPASNSPRMTQLMLMIVKSFSIGCLRSGDCSPFR